MVHSGCSGWFIFADGSAHWSYKPCVLRFRFWKYLLVFNLVRRQHCVLVSPSLFRWFISEWYTENFLQKKSPIFFWVVSKKSCCLRCSRVVSALGRSPLVFFDSTSPGPWNEVAWECLEDHPEFQWSIGPMVGFCISPLRIGLFLYVFCPTIRWPELHGSSSMGVDPITTEPSTGMITTKWWIDWSLALRSHYWGEFAGMLLNGKLWKSIFPTSWNFWCTLGEFKVGRPVRFDVFFCWPSAAETWHSVFQFASFL